MFHEYAVEPTALNSWDRARYFLSSFGPSRGRFLAEYPKHWRRLVYECLTRPDVEKHRIIEQLRAIDPRAFSTRAGAAYDGNRPWLENAGVEHRRRPFHAIIAASAPGGDHVLDAGANLETEPRWNVESGCFVPREAGVVAGKLKILLQLCRRLVVVDPHFRADHAEKLSSVASICRGLGKGTSIEVHWSDEPPGMPSYAAGTGHAKRALPGELPAGMKVTVRCLRRRPDGERLHNRYVLTDVGGVKFGDSIALGERGEHDHLSILDVPSLDQLLQWHGAGTLAYEEGGAAVEIVGIR